MMQKQVNNGLAVFFVSVLCLGYLGNMTLFGGAEKVATTGENRKPAMFPHWHGVKAKDYFAGFDQYVADRLWKRSLILKRMNQVLTNEKWYFAMKDADRAVFGTEGWVFLGNDYSNTLTKHTEPVNEVEWQRHKDQTLENIQRYSAVANHFGARFHILIGPDKPSVYCQNLPSWFLQKPCSKVAEWTDRLLAELRARGYEVTYPQAALLHASESEQVYYKTDTHWNHAGAGVAYRALMKDLKVPAFESAVITHSVSTYRGDLAAISGKGNALPIVNSTAANLTMPHVRILWKTVGGQQTEATLMQASNGADPKFAAEMTNPSAVIRRRVLIFCDSFMTAMSPYINATFRNVLYVSRNRNPSDWQQIINAFQPEIVIYETVERDL